ncbi:MAG: hypothetical protein PHX20_01175 [Candidatus Omnitrophica bacterium]|nr:hypothetical protein [Candidatus Omnitrophota bacterium]MDD5436138.1 hypothetical protein [Candidatus Omnitrophota bacterium]
MKRPGYAVKLLFILSTIVVLSAPAGCCRKDHRKDQVIARINDYELTIDDFRGEAKIALSDMGPADDIEKAKEGALDKLITKKVLLQEAQRENFDKDEKFMKEIERYWEQALLKLLIKKKIDEFSAKISPDIRPDKRQRMLQLELDKWVSGIRSSTNVKINKDVLRKVEVK